MTQQEMQRQSPVRLPGRAENVTKRNGWPVVTAYADEGRGPWVVDLSHHPRWDIQGQALATDVARGLPIPDTPGLAVFDAGRLILRYGEGQAGVWLLLPEAALPPEIGATEVTEGALCVALAGPGVFGITEKLCRLDLADPQRRPPFLVQGPFPHVTSQLVVMRTDPRNALVLVACPRGYGPDLVHALFQAGEEFGLRTSGEDRILGILAETASASNND